MKGFDVSALTGTEDLQVWVEFNDEVSVLVRHVSRETLATILKKATNVTYNRQHQEQREVDNLKYGELVGADAIVDWKGLIAGGDVFPCTPDNIRLVMRKWSDFARFVSDISSDLEQLVEAERAAARKNSATTSEPEPTIQQ